MLLFTGLNPVTPPHPSRLLVPNKLILHCTNAADRERTPWKCRLMLHETELPVLNAPQVEHTKRLRIGGGLGGLVAVALSMGQWEAGGNYFA